MESLSRELELAESRHSPCTKKSVYLGDFILGLSSLKLSSSNEHDPTTTPILSKVSVSILDGSEREPPVIVWRNKWVRLLYTSLVTYGAIKCTFLLLVQLYYEQNVSMLVPGLCVKVNGTQCCKLQAPPKILSYYKEIDRITHLFEIFGFAMANIPVISTLVLMYLTFFVIIAYAVNLIIIANSNIIVDFMGFMANPISEVRRLKSGLEKITLGLSDSFLNRLGKGRCDCMLHENADGCFKNSIGVKLMFNLCQTLNYENHQPIVDPASFLSILRESAKSVYPANLDAIWHKQLVCWFYRANLTFITASVISILLNFTYVVYHCIHWKLILAIEKARCYQLNPDFRQIHNHHIDPMIYQAATVNLSSITGETEWSMSQEFWMSISLGAKIFFRPQRIVSIIEVGLGLVLMCVWAVVIMSIFILSLLDKRRWFKQVEEQLKECIAEELKEEPDHDRIIKLSTSTYLNYALFKSQFVSYIPVSNLIMRSVLLFTSTSLIGIYVSSEKDEMVDTLTRKTLNLSIITLLILSNVYFIMGSYLFSRAEDLMKLLVKQLGVYNNMKKAKDPETKTGLDFIMSSWQRQLLDREELMKDYALTFLGINVTFERVLHINAYSVVMILLMIRY